MASILIHLTIGEEIAKRINLKNNNRFLLGQILPDATGSNKTAKVRNLTHFIKISQEDNIKTYNFLEFLNSFKSEINSDDLYLGYYIHLIEDALFRKKSYEEWFLLEKKIDPDFDDNLYNDYRILNHYLIKKYKLSQDRIVPTDMKLERINSLYSFDIEGLLKDLDIYFNQADTSIQLVYLSYDLLNEFIMECADVCTKEINSILQNGESLLDIKDFSWKIKDI